MSKSSSHLFVSRHKLPPEVHILFLVNSSVNTEVNLRNVVGESGVVWGIKGALKG